MIRHILLISLLMLLLALTACSSSALGARFTCLEWKAQGMMFSTLDSCSKCVQAHGPASLEQVQGCALGMDASVLLDLPNS